MVPSRTYKPFWLCWMVTFEALVGCNDILILGKSRKVDCDVKHQLKQVHALYHKYWSLLPVHPLYHSNGACHTGTFPISQTLVPVIAVHLLYHKNLSLSYRYFLLDPALQIYPLYHTYWSLSYRYIPNITALDPVLPVHTLYLKHWSLSYRFNSVYHSTYPVLPVHPLYFITVLALFYRYIPILYHSTCPVLPVHPLYHSTCPVLSVHHLYLKYLPSWLLPAHPLYQKYWTCATGTPSMSQVRDPAIPVHPPVLPAYPLPLVRLYV